MGKEEGYLRRERIIKEEAISSLFSPCWEVMEIPLNLSLHSDPLARKDALPAWEPRRKASCPKASASLGKG